MVNLDSANRAAKQYALIAGGVGIVGAFGAHLDIPLLIGIWVRMTQKIAQCMDTELDKYKARKIVTGVITGIGGFLGGAKLANTYFAYTGIGTIPAVIANSGTNSALTYIYGKSLMRIFSMKNEQFTTDALVATIIGIIAGAFGSGGDGSSGGSA